MLISNNFRFKFSGTPGADRSLNFLSFPSRSSRHFCAPGFRTPRACSDITAHLLVTPDVTDTRTHNTVTSSRTGAEPQSTCTSPEAREDGQLSVSNGACHWRRVGPRPVGDGQIPVMRPLQLLLPFPLLAELHVGTQEPPPLCQFVFLDQFLRFLLCFFVFMYFLF